MSSQSGGPNFHRALAGQAETGRTCPYCHFALKEGDQLVVCDLCQATHHADCWLDNGGCAVNACAGAPPTPAQRLAAGAQGPPTQRLTAGGPPQPVGYAFPMSGAQPTPPGAQPGWQQPSPPGWRPNWALVAASTILVLAIAGAAVAIVLASSGGGTAHAVGGATTIETVTAPAGAGTTTAPGASTASTSTNAPSATAPTETQTTATTSEGELPAVSGQQMQGEIQHMLLTWHEDVVRGEYHAAWELLSKRKQSQDSREYGFATWAHNQATLRPYLQPSGLQVTVESTEPAEGVAQVNVTGMGWDKPGAPCTEWSGITWVKYEEGSWKYDPGYSTTPQREREWKSRFSELLGGRC